MTIRRATGADRAQLHELYAAFFHELPPPPFQAHSLQQELAEVDEHVANKVALVAETEGRVLGFALARMKPHAQGYVSDLYVRPDARRAGVAKALLAAATEALRAQGATHVGLNVESENAVARTVYERLGFRLHSLNLVVDARALAERTARQVPAETVGSVHVQTDDRAAVERAVAQFVPRLGRSGGTEVSPPRNGWVAVYDELCDREPAALRRLARELSDRMGAVVCSIGVEDGAVVRYVLFDRGRIADEYASVPEYHGALPPGDVIALRANPTVAARLTGADPARVREVAPTAASPGDLPPARDLLARVAGALGIEGAERGYRSAAG